MSDHRLARGLPQAITPGMIGPDRLAPLETRFGAAR